MLFNCCCLWKSYKNFCAVNGIEKQNFCDPGDKEQALKCLGKEKKSQITNLSSVESEWDREMDNTCPDKQRALQSFTTLNFR